MRIALYASCSAVTFVVCFPLIWALFTSLKPKAEIFVRRRRSVPTEWTLENYRTLLTGRSSISAPTRPRADDRGPAALHRLVLNSVIVTVGTTLISIVSDAGGLR